MLQNYFPYRNILRYGLLHILILFLSFSSYAALSPTPQQTDSAASPKPIAHINTDQPEFNLKQANKDFDQLNLKLSVENLNIEHLETALAALNKMMDEAKNCVGLNQKKMSNLENLAKEAAQQGKETDKTITPIETIKNSDKTNVDLAYLNQEQKRLTEKVSQCRLFSFRAQEAIDTYQIAITKIKQQQVLTRSLPLWSLLNHLPKDITQLRPTFPSLPDITISSLSFCIQLSMIFAACILSSLLMIKNIKSHLCTQRLLRIRHIRIHDGLLLLSCLFSTSLGVYTLNLFSTVNTSVTFITELLIIACASLWAFVALNIVFKSKPVSAVFFWYTLDGRYFKNLLIFLVAYYAASQTGDVLIQTLNINTILWQLIQIGFLSLVVIIAIGFLYYFCALHRHILFIHTHQKLIRRSGSLLFLICGALNILGYHQMAIHLIYGIISTFALLFSVFLLCYGIQKLYLLCAYPSAVSRYIIRVFGYRTNQTITEFIILKITLQIIIVGVGLYFIGQTWGYGAYYFNTAYAQIINGIHFASFVFYPTRIVAGLLVFCALFLFFRFISTKFSRHTKFEDEEETQVAVASILTYIGFACALVASLLVSGIDFTGLAIVAGALSVGIGLGLQSIVNNFVSGIILLLEKLVKPGDHISIEGVEGIVKKIRIRSTQITTSSREDVIIPNSDLISRSVTNFMYTDRYLTIHCEVGVAYESDPELVKKLLIQAISDHSEILKSPRAKSTVLFHKFGDSAMIFQVWFLIKDGSKKSAVRSDIHFNIHRLFKEHHIKIAHPVRDINVTLSEIPSKTTDK